MVRCSYCGRETQLYQAGVPTCTICSGHSKDLSIHSRLIVALEQAGLHLDSVMAIHNEAMNDIPSGLPHPDGVQRIRSISQDIANAKESVARAHSRLTEFLDHGTVPEDLK